MLVQSLRNNSTHNAYAKQEILQEAETVFLSQCWHSKSIPPSVSSCAATADAAAVVALPRGRGRNPALLVDDAEVAILRMRLDIWLVGNTRAATETGWLEELDNNETSLAAEAAMTFASLVRLPVVRGKDIPAYITTN